MQEKKIKSTLYKRSDYNTGQNVYFFVDKNGRNFNVTIPGKTQKEMDKILTPRQGNYGTCFHGYVEGEHTHKVEFIVTQIGKEKFSTEKCACGLVKF